MNHPRFTLRTLLMVVAVCAVGAQMLRPEPVPRDDLTPEMFDRVRNGMSKSQILEMYGPPHIHHSPPEPYPSTWCYYPGFYVQELRDRPTVQILGPQPMISIYFDRGKVADVSAEVALEGAQ